MNNYDDYAYPTFFTYLGEASSNPDTFLAMETLKTLWNKIMGFPSSLPPDPTPDQYRDWIAVVADPYSYLQWRYANYELLYEDLLQFDRLLNARIQSNIMEFTKYALIFRSASKQYHDLLLGANGTITNENSYTGLNANGVYNITKNKSESVDTFNRLTQALNTAQTELFLFLDRMIQPLFKLIYPGNI